MAVELDNSKIEEDMLDMILKNGADPLYIKGLQDGLEYVRDYILNEGTDNDTE